MSTPGDPQRSQHDRGYYGAGWSQPAPPAGGVPYGAPQGPYRGQQYGAPAPRPPRTPADPRRAYAPGASVTNTAGALIAVVSIVLVEFVSGLVGLLGASFVVHPFATYGSGSSLVGGFVSGVFATPFPFYAGAFLALAFLTPVDRRSPLPTVLLRAVLAGAAGTIALALVGVVTGTFGAVRSGGAQILIDVVTRPLQSGVPFTLMLIATCTAAWLWLGRPRGGRRAVGAPGTPGTVRPADAVPPATVQAGQPGQPGQGWQPGQPGPQGVQVPPFAPPQAPSDPWGGPAPR
jgi:hypothetical protein